MIRIPYKSFFIRLASTGLWWIERDGKWLASAHNEKNAREIIDKLEP